MSNDGDFSHLSETGSARMVDVGNKAVTDRMARAEAVIQLGSDLAQRIRETADTGKGNVIETARLAGIMAAKKTPELVPLCHPLPLSLVDIQTSLGADSLRLESLVRCTHTTGVEMEAMTAVTVAALTVYDMCKSVSKGIAISSVRLLEKSGGKSGAWRADTVRTGADVTAGTCAVKCGLPPKTDR